MACLCAVRGQLCPPVAWIAPTVGLWPPCNRAPTRGTPVPMGGTLPSREAKIKTPRGHVGGRGAAPRWWVPLQYSMPWFPHATLACGVSVLTLWVTPMDGDKTLCYGQQGDCLRFKALVFAGGLPMRGTLACRVVRAENELAIMGSNGHLWRNGVTRQMGVLGMKKPTRCGVGCGWGRGCWVYNRASPRSVLRWAQKRPTG